jgi:fluoride exporter
VPIRSGSPRERSLVWSAWAAVSANGVPSVDGRELTAIFVGGALGAAARVWIGRHLAGEAPSWPWTTFTVNVTGSFALAYFATRLQERLPLSTYPRPLLGTGLCGAYTTFSTMQVEILRMLDAHRYGLGFGYAFASIVAGYAAISIATALARRIRVIA